MSRISVSLIVTSLLTVLMFARTEAADVNEIVLRVARSLPDGGKYNEDFSGSGTPTEIRFKNERILSVGDGTYCSGYTFTVAMESASTTGLLTAKTVKQVRSFQRQWYGTSDLSREKQCVVAVEGLQVGYEVSHLRAKPGDFVQFWRTKSGHSAIFLGWVTENAIRTGIRYRSSQGSTNGIGDNVEYFRDARKDGVVNRGRTYFCRLNSRSNQAASVLMPDEVLATLSFWRQLRDIDNRPWDSFKATAVDELSQHVTTYINNSPDPARAIDFLGTNGFRKCLEGKYQSSLSRLSATSEELESQVVAADTAAESPTAITRTDDGKVNVPMPEDLMEILWLLGPTEPWISADVDAWKRGITKLATQDRKEWIQGRINSAIHDHAYAERRVAKLRLLLGQPKWMLEFVSKSVPELDFDDIQRQLDQIEQPHQIEQLVKSISEQTTESDLKRIQNEINRIRDAARLARVNLSPKLAEHCLQLKSFLEDQLPILERLERHYKALFAQRHFDFPPTRGPITNAPTRRQDDVSPFLRLHINPPDNKQCRGFATGVQVRVSVCRWIGDSTSVSLPAKLPSDGQAGSIDFGAAEGESLTPIEEIPLGISISDVLFRSNGDLELPRGIVPKVAVDQKQMIAALRRLGMPEQIGVKGISVKVPSLTRFDVSATFEAPMIGASLGQVEDDIREIKTQIVIDLNNLAKGLIEQTVATTVDSLQESFEKTIREELISTATPAPLQISSLMPLGKWRNGTIAYQVGIRVRKIGTWNVPQDVGSWNVRAWCRHESGGWTIGLAPAVPPAGLIRFIHNEIVKYVVNSSFDESSLGKHVATLSKYVRLDDPSYDANAQVFSGTLSYGTELLPADTKIKLPPAKFAIDLRSGEFNLKVFDDFNKQLEAAAQIMLAELLKRINGELTEQAAQLLDEKKPELSLLGAKLKITEAEYDRARIRLRVEGECLGKKIEAIGVLLAGGKVSETGIEKPRFDFSETQLKPEPGKLVAEILDLDDSVVRIGRVNKVPDGISFPLAIHLDELGGDIPLGEIKLGTQGVDANPFAALKKELPTIISNVVLKQLGGRAVIEDLGPVRELSLDTNPDRFKIGKRIELWVKGKAEIPELEGTYLPFSARIVPGPPKIEVDTGEAAKAAMLAGLAQLLPEDFLVGNPVKNLTAIAEAPYGVRFDLEIKAWVFTVTAKGIQVTTKGVQLPASVSVQPPGMIPVPTNFAIVDPGVVVPMSRDGEIGVVGDVTIGSKGIDKIVKFRSILSTSTRHPGTFKLDGTLILVDMLPLLKVDGTAVFDTGVLDLNARTVGFVDKIIQVRDRTHVEAGKGLFEQNGTMRVLGFRLTETNIKIEAFRPAITANAKAKLPIVETEVGVTASPRLSDFEAHAAFDVGLGGFSLQSGELNADAQKVDFRFHVVIFDVRVLAPSITTLTPGRVLEAILSLFDFDISSFFDAIINRKITISFFDSNGKPTDGSFGDGDPPPADDRPAPEDSIPAESAPQGSEQPNQGSPPGSPPAEVGGTPGDDPNQNQTPPQEESPGESVKPREPIENLVRLRQKGDTTYEIVEDPAHAGLFVERYTFRGKPWYGWMSISKAVRDHLREERDADGGRVLVVSWLFRQLTNSEHILNRSGQSTSWVSGYLTMNAKNELHICGRYPTGTVELIEVPLDKIGPSPAGRTMEQTFQFLHAYDEKDPQKKFTNGDINVINQFAKVKFIPNFGSATFHQRLPALQTTYQLSGEVLTRPEGYLLTVTDENQREQVLFQPRVGEPLAIDKTDPIHAHLNLKDGKVDGSQRTANVITLFAHCASHHTPVGYVHGGETGAMLFMVNKAEKQPHPELWTVSESGEFAPAVRIVGDDLLWANRSQSYFGTSDKTNEFAKQLSVETSSAKWDEVLVQQFDSGIDCDQFLASLGGLHREFDDAKSVLARTQQWLADSKDQLEKDRYAEDIRRQQDDINRLEIALGMIEAKRNLRVAFMSSIASQDNSNEPDDWGFALIFRKADGSVARYPASGAFDGRKVAAAFKTKWFGEGLIKNSPFESLDTEEARRWLIAEFLRPERAWTARWKADPVTLLRNVK